MAGLFAIIGGAAPKRIQAAAARLTYFPGETQVFITDEKHVAFTWVGLDDPALFGPANDPKTGVWVATAGRVSWNEGEWAEASGLGQFVGGLSNRMLLKRFLDGGAAAVTRHNGPAALLISDPRADTVDLFTDHFGYHPTFVYRPEAVTGAIIATNPDAIAGDEEARISPDYVSMAEFLRAWRTTPPHTYYNEVKHAGAATHWRWDLRNRTCTHDIYWRPYQESKFKDIAAAAEELAAAIKYAIHIRTLPRLAPIVSYVSGGMDSRTTLFCAADPSQVVGVNLYDVPNREAETARRLCEAAGVRYVGHGRDPEFYPRWMKEGVRLSGGMWSLEDNHFIGTRDLALGDLGARTVLTACTTDWLFKGYGLEVRYERVFGRDIPFKRLTDHRVDGFLPNYPRPAPAEFARRVDERMAEWFEGTPKTLAMDDDHLAVEDRRIRPACYTVSVSGQIMYRAFPYDTFLADRHMADCYSRSRAEWKLNSRLWGMAVARLSPKGKRIVDSNYGWRVDAGRWERMAMFGKGWLLRKLRVMPTVARNGPATDGSWPNLGWVTANSPILEAMWQSTPLEHRQLIGRLWGSDPWATPLSQWANRPADLFRILTLLNHWSVREGLRNGPASKAA